MVTFRRPVIWSLVATGVVVTAWLGYRTVTTRRVAQETDRLAQKLRLTSGSRVADVGAGNGAFSLDLARRFVADGHLFATEIDGRAVTALRARASGAGLDNVSVLQARADATGLPEGCCDAAFLRGVYHHVTAPAETIRSLREALRPGGHLAIVDFRPSWFLSTFFPVRDVPANRDGHGIAPGIVISELTAGGFALIERDDAWPGGQYCLIFERQPDGGP
jgi:SAM-dependent methyltransferase